MRRLLVIDDDLGFSFELEQLFKEEYIIEKSVDGMSALGKINAQIFECVILDIDILGAVDGMQVLRSIKNQNKTQKTPVVVLTNSGLERKEEFLNAGADEYLVKGETSLIDLKATVDRFINTTLMPKKED
ncbi:MAG TPA: response regulator [Candidatus Levybacteria bacterium]|nr:response regulator [Candidatus Levybacteria bacterium]